MSLVSHLRKDVGRTLRDVRGLVIAVALPAGVLLIYSALSLGAFSAFGRDPDAFILVISTAFPALLTGSTALVEERRLGTFARLARSPAKALAVVASKSIAGLLVTALQVAVLLILGSKLLGDHAPQVLSHMPVLALLLLLNGAAAFALGLLISSLVSTEAQAMQLTSLSLLVMLTLSGFLQPLNELKTIGPAAETLPMALGYSSIKAAFQGKGLGAEAVFFVIDIAALVLLATLIARLRK